MSSDSWHITGAQLRAARALLRWTAQDLADKAGVGIATIRRAEAVDGAPQSTAGNLRLMRQALEEAGVLFIDQNGHGPGVRLRDRTTGGTEA